MLSTNFRDGREKSRQELPPDGEKAGCGSWKPTAFLEQETGSAVNWWLLLGYGSSSAAGCSHSLLLVVENSQFGLFLCVERICWDTLEAEVEAGAVDLVEHLLPRFIQHEETLLACKPTSVITADHCWEMNPYFCIVLT